MSFFKPDNRIEIGFHRIGAVFGAPFLLFSFGSAIGHQLGFAVGPDQIITTGIAGAGIYGFFRAVGWIIRGFTN